MHDITMWHSCLIRYTFSATLIA